MGCKSGLERGVLLDSVVGGGRGDWGDCVCGGVVGEVVCVGFVVEEFVFVVGVVVVEVGVFTDGNDGAIVG